MPDVAYTFEHDQPRFHRAPAPSPTELRQLLDTLIARITRTLVRGGVLIEEPEHPYLDLELNSPLELLSAAEGKRFKLSFLSRGSLPDRCDSVLARVATCSRIVVTSVLGRRVRTVGTAAQAVSSWSRFRSPSFPAPRAVEPEPEPRWASPGVTDNG